MYIKPHLNAGGRFVLVLCNPTTRTRWVHIRRHSCQYSTTTHSMNLHQKTGDSSYKKRQRASRSLPPSSVAPYRFPVRRTLEPRARPRILWRSIHTQMPKKTPCPSSSARPSQPPRFLPTIGGKETIIVVSKSHVTPPRFLDAMKRHNGLGLRDASKESQARNTSQWTLSRSL